MKKNSPTVDLILFNANVLTIDPSYPTAELVCIKDGKVLAVGKNDIFEQYRHTNTRVVNCHGHTVLPGFVDAHCHFMALADSFMTCNFTPKEIRSISDIQKKIRKFAQHVPPRAWIRAGTYDEFYLDEKRHPTRRDLDNATPIHPIKLTHRSRHAHILNSLAMEIVGISTETPEPSGSIIERDIYTGEPNGILFEMGPYLSRTIPPMSEADQKRGVRLANQHLLSLGITSIQDASSQNDISRWRLFRKWKTLGDLKCQVTMMFGFETFNSYRQKKSFHSFRNDQVRISGVKIILTETTGQLYPPQSELNEMVLKIHKSGLQAIIHAIEETSIEAACTAIEYALQRSTKKHHRHRIEHCSVCPSALSKRLASLGVLVVTQPSFLYYNGDRYLKTVPSWQFKNLYPIKTLIENGVKVAGSSDCPVVPPNPLIGIYSAVSRRSETGKYVLAQEGITPLDALQMYTDYAARATFEENIKGSITPGKFADLVVLSNDPTKCPTEEIKNIQVEMTVLNGKVVWDKNGLTNNPSLDVRG
ncbi:MAG: amidohydrolase [Proteobacteria bacterium]|nr:amidohydrolase [Pseudomonadota bacterium]